MRFSLSLSKAGLLWLVSAEAIWSASALVAASPVAGVGDVSRRGDMDGVVTAMHNIEVRQDVTHASRAKGLGRRGIAAPQARRLMLLSRVHDLQTMGQYIKWLLSQPLLPASNRQALEVELAKVREQYAAVYAELEAVSKILQENIEESFKVAP
ncbi:hypothetical protein QBC34DRAFT_497080 [Podospora aff. communis PSN243]|uniref:Uncharacterized protein n=1 Tax=Podospora aff. communis PSN243 TaxID=3040156 RepID=A0AAV9GGP0_9PEZI|nr:hypothetical protein QBC34DRAFT_497080 [Podospora aff. communis PSN243]